MYVKIKDANLQYAPNSLIINGELHINPTKQQYLAEGWKELVDGEILPDKAYYQKIINYTEEAESIIRNYVYSKEASPDNAILQTEYLNNIYGSVYGLLVKFITGSFTEKAKVTTDILAAVADAAAKIKEWEEA